MAMQHALSFILGLYAPVAGTATVAAAHSTSVHKGRNMWANMVTIVTTRCDCEFCEFSNQQ